MGVTFASSCVLSLTPSSTCIVISVMSVVAWRHFPASRSPQQSDWHLCANLTKERPATKERPWGSVSLALYSSYRRMMEWQHFSCPLQLYLSCRLPSHAYLSTSNCQRYQVEENEWIKNEKNHQKIQNISLDCTCETMLTLYCICSIQELWVGVQKTEVGIDFSSGVGVAGWKHRGLFHFIMKLLMCSLSEKDKEWRGLRTSQKLHNYSTTACNANILYISSARD